MYILTYINIFFDVQMTSHGSCYIGKKTTDRSSYTKSVKFDYDLKQCENKKLPKSIFTDLAEATLFEESQVRCQYLYEGETELKNVQCTEQYKMIPFRRNANRIMVDIKFTLNRDSQIESKDLEFSSKHQLSDMLY